MGGIEMGVSRGLRRQKKYKGKKELSVTALLEPRGIWVTNSFNSTDRVGLSNEICSVLKCLFLVKQTRNQESQQLVHFICSCFFVRSALSLSNFCLCWLHCSQHLACVV